MTSLVFLTCLVLSVLLVYALVTLRSMEDRIAELVRENKSLREERTAWRVIAFRLGYRGEEVEHERG